MRAAGSSCWAEAGAAISKSRASATVQDNTPATSLEVECMGPSIAAINGRRHTDCLKQPSERRQRAPLQFDGNPGMASELENLTLSSVRPFQQAAGDDVGLD